jgi:hypothetical protein
MVVPALAAVGSGTTTYVPAGQLNPAPGVYNNGYYVSNIYPYDEQGRLLQHVRLYDDEGQPMIANPMYGEPYGQGIPVPATSAIPTATPNPPSNEYPAPVPSAPDFAAEARATDAPPAEPYPNDLRATSAPTP